MLPGSGSLNLQVDWRVSLGERASRDTGGEPGEGYKILSQVFSLPMGLMSDLVFTNGLQDGFDIVSMYRIFDAQHAFLPNGKEARWCKKWV